ncbi:MAG: DUF4157 domain-containing protein [Dokdonella sp.]
MHAVVARQRRLATLAPVQPCALFARNAGTTPETAHSTGDSRADGFDFSSVRGRAPSIQRKATISAPDDAQEREADEVADQVMRMVAPTSIRSTQRAIQRKCATCEDEEKKSIQAKPASLTTAGTVPDTAIAMRATETSGAPLPLHVRSWFELRFGHDFSHVRVHADAEAAGAAHSIQARAYTLGRDVVFGSGEYAPATEAGRRLLAHELTHVVQQRGGSARSKVLQRNPAPPSATDQQVAKMALSDAEKAAFAQMALKGSVPMQPFAVALTGTERFDTPLLAEYFFCSAMQSNPVVPFDKFCIFPGAVSGTPLFEAYREKFIKPEYAKVSAETLAKLAKAHRTADEMKSMLATCDGGLGIWAKAKKANAGREPIIKFGKTDSGGQTSGGTITLEESSDRCTATQVLIQELSNMSRAKDFDTLSNDAISGNLAREDFIKGFELIEYDSGVQNVLSAFDACKSVWKCSTAEKEWARKAGNFDDYYTKLLRPAHKEDYGTWWDTNCKAAYEKKHAKK